jgi:hypothetical protein
MIEAELRFRKKKVRGKKYHPPASYREGRRRLSIDMPLVVHDALLRSSIRHNCTLTSLVIRSVIEKIGKEE